MTEKYVRLKRDDNLKVYCPIDEETGKIMIGLTLIGSIPKGAEIIGEFDEATGKLTKIKEKEENKMNKQKLQQLIKQWDSQPHLGLVLQETDWLLGDFGQLRKLLESKEEKTK